MYLDYKFHFSVFKSRSYRKLASAAKCSYFVILTLFWKCYASHLLITPKVSPSTRGIWEQQHIHPIRYKEKLFFFFYQGWIIYFTIDITHICTYCTCPLPRTGLETFWNTGVQYTKYISDALYIALLRCIQHTIIWFSDSTMTVFLLYTGFTCPVKESINQTGRSPTAHAPPSSLAEACNTSGVMHHTHPDSIII